MEFTKNISELNINDELCKKIIDYNISYFSEFKKYLLQIGKSIEFNLLCENSEFKKEIDSILKENDLLYIENKDVYFCSELNGIFPNFEVFQFSSSKTNCIFTSNNLNLKFSGYVGSILNRKEVDHLFAFHSEILKKLSPNITYYDYIEHLYKYRRGTTYFSYARSSWKEPGINIPIYRFGDFNNKILIFIKENFISSKLSVQLNNYLIQIKKFYEDNIIKIEKNTIIIDYYLLAKFLIENGEYKEKNRVFNLENIKQEIVNKKDLNFDFSKNIIDKLYLNCEKKRADIEPYDERLLFDPNRGHWDLWDCKKGESDRILEFENHLIARNPIVDIKENGVIGIDFGTKSTVVVFMKDKNYIMPMRIGMGNYSSEINSSQYENPTVMQFIDLNEFLDKYNEKAGRPDTEWKNLTISHTAYNSLINSPSDKYYSFLSDLKQWAGNSKENIRIRDEKTFNEILNPYIETDENSFDPIEIYAYYLGLYINNMINGIYLNYILSFPVTYEKAIRERILSSFTRGIKKSLPETILEDEASMKKFKISFGASEPAAYAISALKGYKLKPEDKPIFYGVFDFGGGTTDFDFGLYKKSEGRDKRRFDNVIEHFGAGGDRTLGGENLLELLAFNIFKNNKNMLREKGITFILPVDCTLFKGSETLISSSQEAKLNTKQLMEKLRPLWEENGDISEIESGRISSINLFDKTGKIITGIELDLDINELKQILKDRIEKGIVNFFNALKLSFKFNSEQKINCINIFLAGNSSKSSIVKELFDEYIEKETREIVKSLNIKEDENLDLFRLYPPLGTEESLHLQEKLGVDINSNEESPNCKTGVAFGLLWSREGGRIKVIDNNLSENEINFKYYLGYPSDDKLFVVVDRNCEYNKWIEFMDACYSIFEINYTSLPKAMSGNLDINETKRKVCHIDFTSEDEHVFVYIRLIDPSTIEYVVARDDEIEKGIYLSDIVKGVLD